MLERSLRSRDRPDGTLRAPGSGLIEIIRLAMAVVPASRMLRVDALRAATGAGTVELAEESDFADAFPGCETGAMPPFGNLREMDVYASRELEEDDEIAFNAGDHMMLVRLSWADYKRLVKPTVLDL